MLNQNQETPLCRASHRGWRDIVDLLLHSGSDITHRDKRGSTPLHRAVQSGHLATVELLLRRGADVNIRDNGDKTPLDLARSNGMADVARSLEEHEVMYSQGRTDSTAFKLSRGIRDRQRSAADTWRRRRQYRH
jgi:ankyrin repeat protein